MKKLGLFLFLLLSLLFPVCVRAESAISAELPDLETEEIDRAAAGLSEGLSFTELLEDVFSGELELSEGEWKERLWDMLFGELRTQRKLVVQLVLVVILSAVMKQMTDSMEGKSVGELGFFLCYMVLVVSMVSAFREISQGVAERMDGICHVFGAMLPVFLTLSAAGGDLTGAAFLGSAIMGGSALLSLGIKKILIPAILMGITLELADHITEKPMVGRFAKLLKQCILWGMKGSAALFLFLLSLQKLTGGALSGFAAKTAKIAVQSVPVVGNMMGGAVEMTAAAAGALRSGTLAAAAVFLLLLSLPLLLRLFAVMFLFRLTAAAAEFLAEGRLVKCIEAAGEYTALLLGVVFLGEGMFLFSALLLLGGL